MAPSPRRTRQTSKNLISKSDPPSQPEKQVKTEDAASKPVPHPGTIHLLPKRPTSTITKLNKSDHRLLLRKHDLLQQYDIHTPRHFQRHSQAVSATLVFAQEEAGTAVCIRSDGLLLTCSHCIADTSAELDYDKPHWLLFASGRLVAAKCVAWDSHRDLALMKITAAQCISPIPPFNPNMAAKSTSSLTNNPIADKDSSEAFRFPAVSIATDAPPLKAPLVCVGHPGSEDLEASEPGVKTNYDVLHLSEGAYRGIARGQDLQDNSEIGALQHDCWTYWGHSGAPLLDGTSGELVGLHSSWDDETGMRRGVPLEAIQEFLAENAL
ncbi:trypsin-like cysteine/serine peptidase domain-containing protein [Cercophora scortea]|uniref:Trypsin-like cysteine/serine peptidase domain-containing protein n=1 Tax=Cercophora scortea TaxID=314031 RepID=A0AAE0IGH9_9PEZI|nr:trypsin-like cysteine/serine peptidase domain-containing protein [Cercophora scortea]